MSSPRDRNRDTGRATLLRNRHDPGPSARRCLRRESAHRPAHLCASLRRIAARSGGVLATHRQAPRLDHALQQGQGRLVRRGRSPHPLVPRRRAQRLGELPRPASRTARRQDRDHLGRRRSRRLAPHQLSRASRRGLPLREPAEESRRREGRSRLHLPADDSGSRDRDARVHAHRRGAFGRVRRLLARFARRPHRRFDSASSSSPPTKACAAARRFR